MTTDQASKNRSVHDHANAARPARHSNHERSNRDHDDRDHDDRDHHAHGHSSGARRDDERADNPREDAARGASGFDALGLGAALLRAVADKGYSTPTPIQAQAIPPVLAGRDVLGCAQTGTGKTAAFALPILQRLWREKGARPRRAPVRCLVLCPTRELATQIGESFGASGKHSGLSGTVVFGGVGYGPQRADFERGVDIVVATPGRLIDHMREGVVRFDALEVLVLDEADRMLDMGFMPAIKEILRALPQSRQNLAFTATLPKEVVGLLERILRNPVKVSVAPPSSTAERIEQEVYLVDRAVKSDLLVELLERPEVVNALVFTRTKHGADRVVKRLEKSGIPAAAIHGNKSQNARERALAGLKSGKLRALVATDIASRGIDVKGLSHVVNYDLPNEPETYVHRIGRTARAERDGKAWSLVEGNDMPHLRGIEKLIRLSIPRGEHSFGPGGGKNALQRLERGVERERARRERDDSGGAAPARSGDGPRSKVEVATARARAPRPHADERKGLRDQSRSHAPAGDWADGLDERVAHEPRDAQREVTHPEQRRDQRDGRGGEIARGSEARGRDERRPSQGAGQARPDRGPERGSGGPGLRYSDGPARPAEDGSRPWGSRPGGASGGGRPRRQRGPSGPYGERGPAGAKPQGGGKGSGGQGGGRRRRR
jgi:ATP-dependent RNA helicase RhlE